VDQDDDSLVCALQVPCHDPIVLYGGGYLCLEAAAALATWAPHLTVVLIMRDEHILPRFWTPAIARFYESALAAKGVRFARGYELKRKSMGVAVDRGWMFVYASSSVRGPFAWLLAWAVAVDRSRMFVYAAMPVRSQLSP
jgi:hypothetical protein